MQIIEENTPPPTPRTEVTHSGGDRYNVRGRKKGGTVVLRTKKMR